MASRSVARGSRGPRARDAACLPFSQRNALAYDLLNLRHAAYRAQAYAGVIAAMMSVKEGPTASNQSRAEQQIPSPFVFAMHPIGGADLSKQPLLVAKSRCIMYREASRSSLGGSVNSTTNCLIQI